MPCASFVARALSLLARAIDRNNKSGRLEDEMSVRFETRVGPDPHVDSQGGPNPTPNAEGCPDVWRVSGGDYAVIGLDVTESVDRPLPKTASCGPDERIVLIPKDVLEAASRDLTA
jgi:hypothetical protein